MDNTGQKTPANQSAPTWDMESIFPGGSSSEKLIQYRINTEKEIAALRQKFESALSSSARPQTGDLVNLIEELQKVRDKIELIYSFGGCLCSANVKDDTALQVFSEAQVYQSQWEDLKTKLEELSLKMSEDEWKKLLQNEKISKIGFIMDEIRRIAKMKMKPEKESFALELAVNGYHAWNNVYTKMAGESMVEFSENGESKEISLGQLALKMTSPDRHIRKTAFEKLTKAWQKNSGLAAMMLNSLAGFRLSVYKNRGWKSIMTEPLLIGRLQGKTLDMMWEMVLEATPRMAKYIDAKKRLLGIDKFCWYDQVAPAGKSSRSFSFSEASEFILEQLGGFSEEMAGFTKMALDKHWIEAENRSGKAAGAFCTGLGEIKESRVFMTFENSFDSMLTLAHELGHAYHHHVLRHFPALAQDYPMGLAETASNFNELLVTDAALRNASDREEKIMLLDQKLANAFAMFCNLHARYIFERNFYAEREKGIVGKNRLNELMIDAQRKAFCGMLDDQEGYHPEFWASKLHFYDTLVPYYNFPYTFGFLFSFAIYEKAREEGKSFAKKYTALLSDTGIMMTEDLAKKYLDTDITKEAFWQWVIDKIMEDVDPYVKLAGND